MTKSQTMATLAEKTGLSKKQTAEFLDELNNLAYKEAKNGFTIPGLVSRQSETTVRLSDGQSFAIAGLLSDRMRSQINKVPILGDIPILGALFRSVSYQRDESELLVVITARLTKPVAPHEQIGRAHV